MPGCWARLSEEALTGVTLAFPMQNLMFAVAGGTGVGINAMLSKALGEKKQDEADSAAGNGIVLNMAAALIFMMASFMGLGTLNPFWILQIILLLKSYQV